MNEPGSEVRFGYGVLRGMDRIAREDEERSVMLARLARAGRVSEENKGGRGVRALTDEQVREAKRRRAAGELLQDIAKDHGVTEQTISKICSGERYRGVE